MGLPEQACRFVRAVCPGVVWIRLFVPCFTDRVMRRFGERAFQRAQLASRLMSHSGLVSNRSQSRFMRYPSPPRKTNNRSRRPGSRFVIGALTSFHVVQLPVDENSMVVIGLPEEGLVWSSICPPLLIDARRAVTLLGLPITGIRGSEIRLPFSINPTAVPST